MKKKILLLVITIFLLSFVYGCKQAYAFDFHGVNIDIETNANLNNRYYVIYEFDSTTIGLYYTYSPFNLNAIPSARVITFNKSTGAFIKDEGGYGWVGTPEYANFDVYNGTVLVLSNNMEQKFKHGDKFSIYNNSNTVLNSVTTFTLNSLATGTVFITDENGNFIEQQTFGLSSGKKVNIFLEPKKVTNLYFAFTGDDVLDKYFVLDLRVNSKLSIALYTPTYKIVGGSTIELLGASIPNSVPFISTNYSTSIFYKYTQDGYSYIKTMLLPANEKVYFDKNKRYVIKFLHDNTTTISVKSNFVLNSTNERISLLDDDSLGELIIDNGGVVKENQKSDYIYELNRLKTFKLTNMMKSTLLGGRLLECYVTGSSNTTATVSVYGYDNGTLYKRTEYKIDKNNAGKQFLVNVPSDDGYVVISDTTGLTKIKLLGKYEENVDFKVEFLTDYVPIQEVEDSYSNLNPNPINIGDANDGYAKPVGDGLLDSLFGGGAWSGIGNGDGDSDLDGFKGFVSTFTGFAETFTAPLFTIFKEIPEFMTLAIFGIGSAILLFVLGR